jgi:hypothetical protein
MAKIRNAHNTLVWKPEGKRPFGRPRCRCEGINIDLRERVWRRCGMDASGSG